MHIRDHLFEDLENWVGQDQPEAALESLLNFLKGQDRQQENLNTVILISGRYFRLNRERAQGVLSHQEAQLERNKINQALLETISLLKKSLKDTSFPASGPSLANTAVPDFAFEKIIGLESTIKKIAWLEKGMAAQQSVCRVYNLGYGTGFLVAGGWLYTNHHVISSAAEAAQATAQFNYSEDANGKLLPSYTYTLDETTFYTDEELDFTRVRVREHPDLPPLSKWGHLTLAKKDPLVGEHVTIIQHPEGGPKQIALNENKVTNIYNHYVQYTTDTLPGSSGSPVFNDQWEVVALHHRGGNLKTNDKGDFRFINQAIIITYLPAVK